MGPVNGPWCVMLWHKSLNTWRTKHTAVWIKGLIKQDALAAELAINYLCVLNSNKLVNTEGKFSLFIYIYTKSYGFETASNPCVDAACSIETYSAFILRANVCSVPRTKLLWQQRECRQDSKLVWSVN